MAHVTTPAPPAVRTVPAPAAAGPHARSVSAVATELNVEPLRGLEIEEIPTRRARAGLNQLEAVARPTIVSAIRRAVLEPFVILLLIAGGLAILLGEVRDGILVLAGLVPIVGADVLTSYRSERARLGTSSLRISSRATSCCSGPATSCQRISGSAAPTPSSSTEAS